MTVKYNFKLKPFEHQLAALHKGVQRKEFGYFMEMGTGKSKVLIDNLGMLYLDGQVDFALILEYINEGRSDTWQDYDETDWQEGLREFGILEVKNA